MKKVFCIVAILAISMAASSEAKAWRLFGREFTRTGGHTDGGCAYVDGITTSYFFGFQTGNSYSSQLVGCI